MEAPCGRSPARPRRHRRAPLAPLLLGAALALAAATPAGAQAEREPDARGEAGWVSGEIRVNFRSAPSSDATPLGIVSTGDALTILERREDWTRIETSEGGTGWLPSRYVVTDAPPEARIAELEREIEALEEQLAAGERDRQRLLERIAAQGSAEQEAAAAIEKLRAENRDLRAGERWPYLMVGASILGAGMVAGALLRGASSRRASSRIRF